MLDNLAGYNLILASNSPRRNELMEKLGLKYAVQSLKDVDESYPDDLQGSDIAQYIAVKKADAFCKLMKSDDLIITADTIVCKDNHVYGKPTDVNDAVCMLQSLSGNSHWVYTGVCLMSSTLQRSFTAATEVFFSTLSNEEIHWYVEHYHPLDKAGAYGVQEWIGLMGVERITGSYFNVMGLPVQELYAELKQIQPL
jgi:septum formation protein